MDNLPEIPKPQGLVLDETITNVSASAWSSLFGRYLNWTMGIILFGIAWIIFFALTFTSKGLSPAAGLPFGIFPLIVCLVYYYVIYIRIRHEFYKQFARANGFSYQASGWLPVNGALFNLGHGRKMSEILTGSHDGNHIDLFNYSYTVGSGKSQHTYNCTAAQIEYPSILPAILLVVDSQYFGGIVPLFSSWNEIKPGSAFERNFNLYCKKEFEIEALQIFTPDVLHTLLTRWPQFNLEFNDTVIYVFCAHSITTKAELQSMYELLQYLITKIEPVALRMKSGLQAMEDQWRR